MKFLGTYSPHGDIRLPILAEESGKHFFVQIGQNGAEVRKLTLTAKAGEAFVVPNVFQENDFISFKIKKRNRRLVYFEDASLFSLLIGRDDGEVPEDIEWAGSNTNDSDWIHKETPAITDNQLVLSHEFEQGKEYIYRNGLLQKNGSDYEYLTNTTIGLTVAIEQGETFIATFKKQ